jgi:phosphate transport system protein
VFTGQLAELESRIDSELRDAASTLAEIADAVLDPTIDRCEAVARSGRRLKSVSRRIDADLVAITARQAPVAGDLRRVLAMIEVAQHASLIGNQFVLISEQLSGTDGWACARRATTEKLVAMASLARSQLEDAAFALKHHDLATATKLDREDDGLDALNREVFSAAYEGVEDRDHREVAMRQVLIARSLERIGDNAVDIAERAAFLITAKVREFSDASHPQAAHR